MKKEVKKSKNPDKPKIVEALIILGLSLFFVLLLLGAFGKAGKVVSDFFTGVFGYALIGYSFAGLAIGVLMLFNFHLKKSLKTLLLSVGALLLAVMLFQVVSSKAFFGGSYGEYLSLCYKNARTAGGLLAGLLAYPLMKLNYVFAVVLFSLAFAGCAGFLLYSEFGYLFFKADKKSIETRVGKYKKYKKPKLADLNAVDSSDYIGDEVGGDLFVENIDGSEVKDKFGKSAFKKEIEYTPIADERFDENAKKADAGMKKLFDDEPTESVARKKEFSEEENPRKRAVKRLYEDSASDKKQPESPKKELRREDYRTYTNDYYIDNIKNNLAKNRGDDESVEQGGEIYDSIVEAIVGGGRTDDDFLPDEKEEIRDETCRDEGPLTDFLGRGENIFKPSIPPQNEVFDVRKSMDERSAKPKPFIERLKAREKQNVEPSDAEPPAGRQKPERPRERIPYNAPPVSLLRDYPPHTGGDEDFTQKSVTLENTLSTFGINATVIGHKRGPAFTRYELQMPAGISVKKVANLADDIAMCMEATSIRIQAPIPGKNAVGVEIPNEVRDIVGMKDLVCSPEFNNTRQSISFVLGKDIDGACKIEDLTKMPHMLIAGATGSGKSVGINALICSILYKYSPDDVKLILIDPKMVDLNVYSGIPHLLVKNIITEDQHVIKTLDWAINEMMDRYAGIRLSGTQKLTEYNEWAKKNGKEPKPFIVIVIDEFAELMERIKKDLEEKIKRLTQLARAAGIHLVIATQRPSVDIITGVIKSNLPTRVAFKVASQVDSRTILDSVGAEKLLGDGDMLFSKNASDSVRLQGAFLSSGEVNSICQYIRDNNEAFFEPEIEERIFKEDKPEPSAKGEEKAGGYDRDYLDALRLAIDLGEISTSKLQRKMMIGYPKAARLIDKMEEDGFIERGNGTKPRPVLITMDEYEKLLSDGDMFDD